MHSQIASGWAGPRSGRGCTCTLRSIASIWPWRRCAREPSAAGRVWTSCATSRGASLAGVMGTARSPCPTRSTRSWSGGSPRMAEGTPSAASRTCALSRHQIRSSDVSSRCSRRRCTYQTGHPSWITRSLAAGRSDASCIPGLSRRSGSLGWRKSRTTSVTPMTTSTRCDGILTCSTCCGSTLSDELQRSQSSRA